MVQSSLMSASGRLSTSVLINLPSISSTTNGIVDYSGKLIDNNEEYGRDNQHLFKSGPLGRCDDPYCTTCPYFEYSRSLSQSKETQQSFLGGLRTKWVNVFQRMKLVPGIINPHTKLVQRWNQFFAISSLVAIFVDPLFFFIFSVKKDRYCIFFDARLATGITLIRSITDSLYFLHMLLQFRLAYVAPASKSIRAGSLQDDPNTIALHYLKGWFLVDLVAVLPLPQVLLWFVVIKDARTGVKALYIKDVVRAVILLQYLPRIIRFLPLLFGMSQSGFVFETARATFTINFFLYVLAGHVVGSCWYLFGLQRVNVCLHDACSATQGCHRILLDCGNGDTTSSSSTPAWGHNGNVASSCFGNGSNSPNFPYGIYQVAVPVTFERDFIPKYVYAVFWGFLQISTLGGNLVPSIFAGEVLFTMGVIGLGLLLFALLIGNMQNFLQFLTRRQLEMQFRRYDVAAWMKRRSLSLELQKQVKQAVRFKWLSTRGVNEEKLLENLPDDLQKDIRRFLCFKLVKKVPIFTVMDEQVLDAICERLQKRLYIEGSEILEADGPVNRMLFIVRGNLVSIGKDGSKSPLTSGDICGEELLTWCLGQYANQSSMRAKYRVIRSAGHRAISSRTVYCETGVEAFSLEEKDLLYVTSHYSRHMRNPRVQGAIRYNSPYFRSWAAGCIQAAWRYQRKKKGQMADRYYPRRYD